MMITWQTYQHSDNEQVCTSNYLTRIYNFLKKIHHPDSIYIRTCGEDKKETFQEAKCKCIIPIFFKCQKFGKNHKNNCQCGFRNHQCISSFTIYLEAYNQFCFLWLVSILTRDTLTLKNKYPI